MRNPGLVLLLALVVHREARAAAPVPCQTMTLNDVYRCPSQGVPASAEFLYVKFGAAPGLYAASYRNTVLEEAPLYAVPQGWQLEQSSISPNRKIILSTMIRPDCPPDPSNPAGASCSWGRGVLFLAFLKTGTGGAKYYELLNLASQYGRNSAIVGWQTWLTTKKVLFNAKILPDGEQIMPDPLHGNGFAYTLSFETDDAGLTGMALSLWGGNPINDQNCFVGRMHASRPAAGFSDRCGPGQKVVFARRCYDDTMGPQNFSWFNTVNYDGTGGVCRPESEVGPRNLVPAFKNYVVTVDSNCNPISFDRNAPIRSPDYTGRYRHMGTNPEWGDGQPTITLDGTVVAFWSKKSSTLSNPVNNCAGLESANGSPGNGAERVRVCLLDAQNRCSGVFDLPQPADAWSPQGGAYFYAKDGHLAVFTSESDGAWLTDLVVGTRVKVLQGPASYPIMPAP